MFSPAGTKRKSSLLSFTRRASLCTVLAAGLLVFYARESRRAAHPGAFGDVLRGTGLSADFRDVIEVSSRVVDRRDVTAEMQEQQLEDNMIERPISAEMDLNISRSDELVPRELIPHEVVLPDLGPPELASKQSRVVKKQAIITKSVKRTVTKKESTESKATEPELGDETSSKPEAAEGKSAKAKSDNTREEGSTCLRSILYDKPVKTASTSITYAIRKYLHSTDRFDLPCNMEDDSCLKQSERMCLGMHARQHEKPSLIGHLKQSNGTAIECLRKMGYYSVTSIRDPYQRRKSAYLYNKTVKGRHYAIPYTATFREFMDRLPRCIMHHDYDGLGPDCDVGMALEERVKRIVDRYDEVIELGGQSSGKLFKKIAGFVERQNASKKEVIVDEKFNEETLKEETMLYSALRGKMGRQGARVPC